MRSCRHALRTKATVSSAKTTSRACRGGWRRRAAPCAHPTASGSTRLVPSVRVIGRSVFSGSDELGQLVALVDIRLPMQSIFSGGMPSAMRFASASFQGVRSRSLMASGHQAVDLLGPPIAAAEPRLEVHYRDHGAAGLFRMRAAAAKASGLRMRVRTSREVRAPTCLWQARRTTLV